MKITKKNQFIVDDDVLALKLLENFLPKSFYLPYTSSSLSFESIRIIANDIVVHKRQTILEFGSGISTIILGSLLDSLNSGGTIISIDENAEWVELLNQIIEKEGIKSAKIIHQDINLQEEEMKFWYKPNGLNKHINDVVNMVLVDGPSAWQAERSLARAPALDFILKNNLLNLNDFSIYLDDCNRKGEKEIIKNWSQNIDSSYSILKSDLGRIAKNDKFNII